MNREQYFGAVAIISGPSGVGKSTIYNHMKRMQKNLHFSVSCTTRKPRPGELDGMAYHFIGADAFAEHIEHDDFLEFAEVHGAWYGTLKSEMECVKKGKDLLLDIDTQGMHIVREKLKTMPFFASRLVTVFIAPPSLAELESRLRGRGTESEEAIERRLANGRREMAEWRDYDYLLINRNAETAAAQLSAIICTSHYQTRRMTEETWLK